MNYILLDKNEFTKTQPYCTIHLNWIEIYFRYPTSTSRTFTAFLEMIFVLILGARASPLDVRHSNGRNLKCL